jgi:hypothetical protein
MPLLQSGTYARTETYNAAAVWLALMTFSEKKPHCSDFQSSLHVSKETLS